MAREKISGRILEVSIDYAGDELLSDHTAGALTLFVDDTSDFDEFGGTLDIEGVQYIYLATNEDLGTVSLFSGLTAQAPAGTTVRVYPLATEKYALVDVDGQDDAVECRVPHSLQSVVPDGVRTPATMEDVEVQLIGNEWVLSDVVGKTPELEGKYITDLPPPESQPSDGFPPGSSPTPRVTGALNAIVAEFDLPELNSAGGPQVDPMAIAVHLGTTAGFVPTTANRVTNAGSSPMWIRHLPGTGTPLTYGTTYYVKTVARDEDGAAAASAEGSAAPVKINSPDVAAEYVYAGTITADKILAGTMSAQLTVSGRIATALTGGRVQMDSTGLKAFAPGITAATVVIGTDGKLIATGSVSTGRTGQRRVVLTDTDQGLSMIQLYTGSPNESLAGDGSPYPGQIDAFYNSNPSNNPTGELGSAWARWYAPRMRDSGQISLELTNSSDFRGYASFHNISELNLVNANGAVIDTGFMAPLTVQGSEVRIGPVDGGKCRFRLAPATAPASYFQQWANAALAITWLSSNDNIRISNGAGDGWRPIQASAFNVNSDIANKENVEDVAPGANLAALRKLQVIDFDRVDDGEHYRGLSAQQVKECLPAAHAVQDEQGGQGIDVMGMIAALVGAVQDLAIKIEEK